MEGQQRGQQLPPIRSLFVGVPSPMPYSNSDISLQHAETVNLQHYGDVRIPPISIQGSQPLHPAAQPFAGQPHMARQSPLPPSMYTQFRGDSSCSPSVCPSPVTVSDTSDDHPMLTPASSRRSSAFKRPAQSISSSSGSGFCDKCNERMPCAKKRHHKGVKEKNHRQKQAGGMQDIEDLFECVFNYVPSKQQGVSNGWKSGLRGDKHELLMSTYALMEYLLVQGLMQALRNGTEDEFRAECQRRIRNASRGDSSMDWTAGDSDEEECGHEGNEKNCTVHGSDNWVMCRKRHKEARFKGNLKRWKAEHLLTRADVGSTRSPIRRSTSTTPRRRHH